MRKLRNQILFWFVISLFIIFACFPVYWMFVTTFKEVNDLYNLQNNPLLFHLPPTFEQVQYLFERTNFATWVENTAEVGGAVVLITVLICVPAAYALARVRFPGSGSLGIGIFLTYLVPPTLLFLPLSQLVAGFGLNNSKWSL
ncbi:MAG: carbohydrate ABC transporter permease, partial [Chloroflexi bacterium]